MWRTDPHRLCDWCGDIKELEMNEKQKLELLLKISKVCDYDN